MRDYPETEWSMEVHSLRIPSHTPFLSSNETAEHEKIFKEGARIITLRGGADASPSLHAFLCWAHQNRNGVSSPATIPHPPPPHIPPPFPPPSQPLSPMSIPNR